MEKQNYQSVNQTQNANSPLAQRTPSADMVLSKCRCQFSHIEDMGCVKAAGKIFPITWFGDLKAYFQSEIKVVTIGLNPSNREFSEPRFFGRRDLGYGDEYFPITIDDWQGDKRQNVFRAFNDYFNRNPYNWFKTYERIFKNLNSDISYGGTKLGNPRAKNKALHIDFYSGVATNPTWGKLSKAEKEELSNDIFALLYGYLKPDVVLFSTAKNDIINYFKLTNDCLLYKDEGYIEAYHKGNTSFIWGRNFNGMPFQSVGEPRCKAHLPQIAELISKKCKLRTPQEGVFWIVPAVPIKNLRYFMGNNFDIFDFIHSLRNPGYYILSVFEGTKHHSDLWKAVTKKYPEYSLFDYEFFPRGRVWIKDGEPFIFIDGDAHFNRILNEVKWIFRLPDATKADYPDGRSPIA